MVARILGLVVAAVDRALGLTCTVPIVMYWLVVAPSHRKTCLYNLSCSRLVFDEARRRGMVAALAALRTRWARCRAGYRLVVLDGALRVKLADGTVAAGGELRAATLNSHRDALRAASEAVRNAYAVSGSRRCWSAVDPIAHCRAGLGLGHAQTYGMTDSNRTEMPRVHELEESVGAELGTAWQGSPR